jgi:hypothetical protein
MKPKTRGADLAANLHAERFKHTTKVRPLVRLFRAVPASLHEVSLSGSGVRLGANSTLDER